MEEMLEAFFKRSFNERKDKPYFLN